MKKFKFTTFAMAALLMAFTSCDKNDDNGVTNGTDTENNDATLLSGELTADKTLAANGTYTLSGGFTVKKGVTLTIEEGVKITSIDDNIVDYILVEQGAQIDAQGTAQKPIVMTSQRKEAGAWGGLHICGRAPINVDNARSEIGDAAYGGTDVNDNSGILRYIRIEYAGYAFSEEKEANGFTFYGVGAGTTVEYLQAYKGSDDGFEWFGGTVNVKYLVSTSNSDDSFDWTEGWSGKGQFLLAYQEAKTSLGYDCDCLIEADNNSKNYAATPISKPVLANLTLIGNGSSENTKGVRLRAGTRVELYNALITGKTNTLTTETDETENALVAGNAILKGLSISTDISCKESIYSSALFVAAGNGNAINQELNFTNTFVGTLATDISAPSDDFFVPANFRGAVPSDNVWTAGWTL